MNEYIKTEIRTLSDRIRELEKKIQRTENTKSQLRMNTAINAEFARKRCSEFDSSLFLLNRELTQLNETYASLTDEKNPNYSRTIQELETQYNEARNKKQKQIEEERERKREEIKQRQLANIAKKEDAKKRKLEADKKREELEKRRRTQKKRPRGGGAARRD